MRISRTLKFILDHPLNRGKSFDAISRYIWWQIASRMRSEITVDWIGGTKLVVRPGMTGTTGNIYCGLHEYADMSFILHLLRPGDVFIDAGANVGSYTVLASGVCGARSIAFEPDPGTAAKLQANIDANDLDGLVDLRLSAIGAEAGEIRFTTGADTMNRVAHEGETDVQIVPVAPLDLLINGEQPTAMKMDLEGFETAALEGAKSVLANPSLMAVEIETVGGRAEEILTEAGFLRYTYDPATRTLARKDSPASSNTLFLRNVDIVQERLLSAPVRSYRGRKV